MSTVVRFFLPCDEFGRHFYAVEFYPDKGSRNQALKALFREAGKRPTKLDLSAEAACVRYIAEARGANKRIFATGELGTLFFIRGQAGPGAVVHEITHAAIGWAKRTKTNPMKHDDVYEQDPEEKFARTIQFMVDAFYIRAPKALAAAA